MVLSEAEKDEAFALLGRVATHGERVYMRERAFMEKGHANAHVVIYWGHLIFELLRHRFLLRDLPSQRWRRLQHG